MRLISSLTQQRKPAGRLWPWPMPIGFHQWSNSHKSSLLCYNSPVRSLPLTDGFMLPSSVPPTPPQLHPFILPAPLLSVLSPDTACKVPWEVLDFSLTYILMVHVMAMTARRRCRSYMLPLLTRSVCIAGLHSSLAHSCHFLVPLFELFSLFLTWTNCFQSHVSASPIC